jgi:NAD(P)-dependent dehydrogenase (short-subunit alcohol dehydrogenase family)
LPPRVARKWSRQGETASRKVALVTGAQGAVGSAVARRLLKERFAVIATDRVAPSKLPSRIEAWRMDVGDEAAVRAVRAKLADEHRQLHCLVVAAGLFMAGSILTTSDSHWRTLFEVNLMGAMRCIRAFGEVMAKQGSGRIITIASLAAQRGFKGAAGYAASKAALVALTQTAALELASSGVTAVSVLPGFIDGGMGNLLTAKQRRTIESRSPLGRLGSPEEVAEVVAMLASGQPQYCWMEGSRSRDVAEAPKLREPRRAALVRLAGPLFSG